MSADALSDDIVLQFSQYLSNTGNDLVFAIYGISLALFLALTKSEVARFVSDHRWTIILFTVVGNILWIWAAYKIGEIHLTLLSPDEKTASVTEALCAITQMRVIAIIVNMMMDVAVILIVTRTKGMAVEPSPE